MQTYIKSQTNTALFRLHIQFINSVAQKLNIIRTWTSVTNHTDNDVKAGYASLPN